MEHNSISAYMIFYTTTILNLQQFCLNNYESMLAALTCPAIAIRFVVHAEISYIHLN